MCVADGMTGDVGQPTSLKVQKIMSESQTTGVVLHPQTLVVFLPDYSYGLVLPFGEMIC